jgi:hypothetical protein
VGEDLEEVRRIVQAPFIEYLRSSMDLWWKGSRRPDDLRPQEREKLLLQAFERYFQTSALFGTQQTCAAFVTSLQEAGVDEIACLIDFGIDLDTTIGGLHELDVLRQHHQALSVSSQAR